MRVIVGNRGVGKTTKLMEMVMKDSNAILVVFCQVEKDRILKEFLASDHSIPVIVWDNDTNFRRECALHAHKNFYIDNIEVCLRRTIGNVEAISLTGVIDITSTIEGQQ